MPTTTSLPEAAPSAGYDQPTNARSATNTDAARLAQIAEDIPAPAEIARVAGIFKLLGDPTRARLLYALRAAGSLAVCDLAEVTGLAEATVSQSLRLLRTSGVVIGERRRRHVVYSLSDEHVELLLDVTQDHSRHAGADEQAGSPEGTGSS